MKTPQDLAGKKFGKLTAISISHKKDSGAFWHCECECGNKTIVRSAKLNNGSTRSCGCLIGTSGTHLLSKTTEYSIWTNIKTRCYNPKHRYFYRYGGRGIVLCERWSESFENFLADMGPRPSPKHTIDRINNDGNYEKANCRWATMQEQQNNKSSNEHIEYFGVRLTLAEAGRISHLKESAIRRRLKLGWTINNAMSAPLSSERGMV